MLSVEKSQRKTLRHAIAAPRMAAMVDEDGFSYAGAELVLGLVAPVGTDLDKFVEMLSTQLQQYRYEVNAIRLSDLAESFHDGRASPRGRREPEFARIQRLMDAGNTLRERRADFLANAAAVAINRRRGTSLAQPLVRHAHVLRSLKHPGEVHALRRIYGPGFFLIGVLASSEQRRRFLSYVARERYAAEMLRNASTPTESEP